MSTADTTTATVLRPRVPRRVWAQRIVVVATVLIAIVLWRNHQSSNDLSSAQSAQRFIDSAEMAWWAILAYVGVYLARPVVLFPASVLTVVGGVLFGPVIGLLVVVVAANASAMVAYWIGRSLGRAPSDSAGSGSTVSVVERWSDRMRTNSFETVLIMRLIFLPYDLVNYASGFLHIKATPFLTATALGSIPGTVSFVLIGASLERVDEGFGGIEPIALGAGLAIFVVSLVLARFLKNRQRLVSP